MLNIPTKVRLVPGVQNSFEVSADESEAKREVASVTLKLRRTPDGALDGVVPINENSEKEHPRRLKLTSWTQTAEGKTTVRVLVPEFETIEKHLNFKRQWTSAHELSLEVCSNVKAPCTDYAVEVPYPVVAWLTAIAAIVGTWIFFGFIWAFRSDRPKKSHPGWEMFRFPLAVCETELRRYSLSTLQSVIWSAVVIFGLAFVWKIKAQFVVVTPQVLMLLGIGGGTALLSAMASRGRIQQIDVRYRDMLLQERPRWSDFIGLDGRPNIARVQMLSFTVIIAMSVLKSIWELNQFPELSDGLVALMGISSAVYVGGNVVPGVPEQKLKEAIATYETLTKDKAPDDPAVAQHKADLKSVLLAYVA